MDLAPASGGPVSDKCRFTNACFIHKKSGNHGGEGWGGGWAHVTKGY